MGDPIWWTKIVESNWIQMETGIWSFLGSLIINPKSNFVNSKSLINYGGKKF